MTIGIVKQTYTGHSRENTLRKKALYFGVAAALGYIVLSSGHGDSPVAFDQQEQQQEAENSRVGPLSSSVSEPVRQWYKTQTAALSHAWGRIGWNAECGLQSHAQQEQQQQEELEAAGLITTQKAAPSGPLSQYMCLGDDLTGGSTGDEAALYTKPFRFHIYSMPDHLLADVYNLATPKWFNTQDSARSQFLTERQIVDFLHLHPCHTTNEEEADAFIIPAQTVSATWLSRETDADDKETAWNDEGRQYRKDVEAWLSKKIAGQRFGGRDHYAVSIPWWAHERPYSRNIGLIGVEVPTMFDNQQSFNDALYASAATDITIPYPDPDSVRYYTDERLGNITKDLTAVFVGQMPQNGPVRRFVRDQFHNYNVRQGKELAVWSDLKNRDDIRSLKTLLARATFGPVMPGDSYTSRRLFSLIFAGTIPLIICDRCILPYSSMINYRKFAIFLSEDRLMNDPTYDLFEELERVTPEQIASYQHYGRLVQRHFKYGDANPLPGDAMDLLVREMALTHYRNRETKDMMIRAQGSLNAQGQLAYPAQQFMTAEETPVEQGRSQREEALSSIPSAIDVDSDEDLNDVPAKPEKPRLRFEGRPKVANPPQKADRPVARRR